ncbi:MULTISPECIES: hypothetical protein [unclassified Microcoleus]|uniref:hypothetical protein n=1 Tax=unclassified Microcoleus TaxID=2642155 RepID=UPI001D5A79D3|nr:MULTISPECIES: hypothetical protein [unclassified Microcoleus]MCC3445204.1 hypothetical protein [Microcoleus sp. PH2017_03_ELD_O_A]MCC3468880.1 hypothetical protein [Microcoleus sp. PH2017_06_SFM_O_A]MCC3502041.1 hypothetical protein [Microcoleus sp. PH2017_19_SFW_U_A]TAE52745.1 MAG: hypothetical protein EAZ88_14155 [Oscillatoriales cyanobacterium]MCC3413212.1 hypothetical protein [Microcoleus sp. PH2017_02_FOX_O_A]
MDFLLIIARLFEISGTAGDRPCISDQRCAAHFGALCGIQVKAAEISTPSSLPSSRPGKMLLALRIATHNYLWALKQKGFGNKILPVVNL